ncbi:Lsr2 family protein [Nocardioides bigeumensis]|uniref:Lsr2 family protein n=1 Tax=Nocardioides bigeumensis TaxID=433657 RepID=A0ABP5KIM1_9ACTN
MAQKVNIVLVDDLDGSEASETISFGLDGATYEIDLNDKNAGKLRDALAPYLGHARKVTGAGRRGRKSSGGGSGPNPKQVRDWARSNGYEVSDRGRVPADVIAAFEAAN